jgi:hypothetical protein
LEANERAYLEDVEAEHQRAGEHGWDVSRVMNISLNGP